jgi:hypothetical protein
MTFQIPLKKKYRWKPRSRFGHTGDDNLKRVKKVGATGPIVAYSPGQHVLYLKDGAKRSWLHGDAAEQLTSRPDNSK